MVLRVIAHLSEAEEGGPKEVAVELDDFTLLFFETVLAELKAKLGVDSLAPFDYLEYEEDGYPCNVKTDEEIQSLSESPPEDPLHIWLKSSRHHHAISDDFILNSADFIMKQELATGQFGTVYLAEDIRHERLVAVKSIIANLEMAKMQQEVEILSEVRDCPQIVEFFGAIFEDDHIKIILEYMDGLSLDKYEPLPIDVHGVATVSIINALSFLWSKSIIHRDIKPSNFLVNSNGDVKLADFGVSRTLEFSNAFTGVGTAIYLPPERIKGGAYSVSSDVWSFGLSLTEMALGSALWTAQNNSFNIVSDFSHHIIENLAKIFEEIASIDFDLQALISGCLKPIPNERLAFYDLKGTKFVKKYSSVNKKVVADFILSKQSVNAGFV
uniref:Protein kinase domain-containing protein n=1 Tax=Panagrolaimus sp. ES5 TaxID=591445 RepID=A0AC34FET8_9BILA